MLTFARFIKQLPDEDGRYELVNGEIVKILLTIRLHENVADFIENTFHDEVKRINLNLTRSGFNRRIILNRTKAQETRFLRKIWFCDQKSVKKPGF